MGRRNKPDSGAVGIAIVNKEAGWTSHDVVAKARGILGTSKVGHSGTLDPDATGVLVLGIGKATKLLRFLQELPKTYECDIVFGVNTSTLDASGDVTETFDMELDAHSVQEMAQQLVGDILQIPPMVSAVKIDGRRLHELAREGKVVDRPPRPVTVYSFETSPTDNPLVYRAVISCSSGTYVRVLGEDLGALLDGGAHITNLSRTSVGAFKLSDAVELDDVAVLPIEQAVLGFPSVTVREGIEARVRQGAVLDRQELDVAGSGPWPVMSSEHKLLAMYAPHQETSVKPMVVLC